MPHDSPLQRRLLNATLAALGLLLAGCRDEVRFSPDELSLVEQQVTPVHRVQLESVLTQLFGTPDEPAVPAALADVLDIEQLRHASGPVASHTPGETVGLYRRHCAVCHGPTGDGAGPAALYQYPYPRDFRPGVFAYKSTYRDAPPTDADLEQTLRHGVPGTAMPSFALLPEDEIDSLIAYVKYLAIRGQAETALVRYIGEELADSPAANEAEVGSQLSLVDPEFSAWLKVDLLPGLAEPWRSAEAMVVPASISALPHDARALADWASEGEKLFHDTQHANCVKCHGKNGSGEGQLKDYNIWNKRRNDFYAATTRLEDTAASLREQLANTPGDRRAILEQESSALDKEIAARHSVGQASLPARASVARRLLPGALRGTPSPEDLFRRIQQGIAGSPMPAVGATEPGGHGALSNEQVWKLAAYVMKLTGMSPADSAKAPQD